jgi:uncharacterized protein YcbK (DUF882 family)
MRSMNRRSFMTRIVPATVATTLLPWQALASRGGTRNLAFRCSHTGETVDTVYRSATGYEPEGLADLNYILRDWRNGNVKPMNLDLLDLLHDLRASFSSNEPFYLISGYRSPRSNALLANKSSGVAKKSLHMRGMAVDIRLPGVALDDLRARALEMQRGGVGYYARSDFLHVDTGRVRFW